MTVANRYGRWRVALCSYGWCFGCVCVFGYDWTRLVEFVLFLVYFSTCLFFEIVVWHSRISVIFIYFITHDNRGNYYLL